jgi:hypothetical protein
METLWDLAASDKLSTDVVPGDQSADLSAGAEIFALV